jgi:hypothetical protein
VLTTALLLASEDADDRGLGGGNGGLLALLLTVGLAVGVIFLYRSLRTQLKRINFNAEGTTDAERMQERPSAAEPGKRLEDLGDVSDESTDVNGYHKPSS